MAGVCAAAIITIAVASQSPQAADNPDTLGKEEIRQIVREYLLEHPEVVTDALDAYQERREEIEQRKFEEALKNHKTDLTGGDHPFAGNPEGNIVITEFFDYNCGYCKRAIGDINKVLEADKNVKIVFREMPILSGESYDASRYALAAHRQGKYFEYHQALLNSSAPKNKENLEKIAGDMGLDTEKLAKDADSQEIKDEIEQGLSLARKLGIRGTPAFIIGNTFAPGYIPSQAMLEIIKKERNGAKAQ